jgi:hypothetical protein
MNNVMRHQYRKLETDDLETMKKVKDVGLEFYELIESLGASRETSIAKTKVEEAVLWSIKHVTS